MVNYKRVVCEVAVLAVLVCLTRAAPAADCRERETHYDQRQNGTENFRVNIDGVVIAVAPAESLLSAIPDVDLQDLFEIDENWTEQLVKPKPPADKPPKPQLEPKPQDGKPQDGKPQDGKPQEAKPDQPAKPEDAPLSDVSLSSDLQSQKKEAVTRKHEKAQRLKNRLASILVPLLRRTRHH